MVYMNHTVLCGARQLVVVITGCSILTAWRI